MLDRRSLAVILFGYAGMSLPCACASSPGRDEQSDVASVAQASVISPELGTDTPQHGPGDRPQYSPAITFDGTGYLVVWQDSRRKSAASPSNQLFAVHVTKQGEVLDPGGIPITTQSAGFPDIAFDGTHHLIVWQQAAAIFGARFEKGGQIVAGTSPAQLSAGNGFIPHVAYDGVGTYLVVWRNGPNGSSVEAATVKANGGAASAPFVVSSTPISDESPVVAWGAGAFLVAWLSSSNVIRGTRLNANGAVVGATDVVLASAPYSIQSPALASDGTEWLLTWEAFSNGSNNIEAALLDASASQVGGQFTVSHSSALERRPQVVFTGANYYVVWTDNRDSGFDDNLYAGRISTAGAVIDANDIPVCTAPGPQATQGPEALGVACDVADGSCFAVWEDDRNSARSIYGTRIENTGLPSDVTGMLIGSVSNIEQNTAVASDGTNFLVVWEDFRNGKVSDIRGVLLDAMGVPTGMSGANGFVVSSVTGAQTHPSVAWNGSRYLVVWADERNAATTGTDIFGATVSPDGALLDIAGKAICTALGGQTLPAVASNGTDFLVAWEDSRSGNSHIFVAHVDPTGDVDVTQMDGVELSDQDEQLAPAVASDGDGYLVVWGNHNPALMFPNQTFGLLVDNNGKNPMPPNRLLISPQGETGTAPRVAHGNGVYFVAWNGGADFTPTEIAGTIVDPMGAVLGKTVLGSAKNQVEPPSVAWDGYSFLVTWQVEQLPAKQYDILATRVDTAGKLIEAVPTLVAGDSETDETLPALSPAGAGRSIVAYERYALPSPYGSKRAFVRFVSIGDEPGTPCSEAESCNSLNCIDGVCCDTPCGGGDPTDCQACDLMGSEGICSTVPDCSGTGGGGGTGGTGGGGAGGAGGGSSSSGSGAGPDAPTTSFFACQLSDGEDRIVPIWVLLSGLLLARKRSRRTRSS